MRLALQVGVFTPLADGPADAATVARACGCSLAGVAHLLDVLASTQVLTRHEGRYALTPSAAMFLVRGRPAYAGDLILAWTGPALGRGCSAPCTLGDRRPSRSTTNRTTG
jgi:hypothetical protein